MAAVGPGGNALKRPRPRSQPGQATGPADPHPAAARAEGLGLLPGVPAATAAGSPAAAAAETAAVSGAGRAPRQRRRMHLVDFFDDGYTAAVASAGGGPGGSAAGPSAGGAGPSGRDGSGGAAADGAADAAAADDDAWASADVPDDVHMAVLLLRSQFPPPPPAQSAAAAGAPGPRPAPPAGPSVRTRPLALRTQVYALLRDRTAVDRSLQRLASDGALRLLKLTACGPDDYAAMTAEDYAAAVRGAQARAAARLAAEAAGRGAGAGTGSGPGWAPDGPDAVRPPPPALPAAARETLLAFDWFLSRVLPALGPAVAVTHGELLRLLGTPPPAGRPGPHGAGPRPHDGHVSALVHAGLLTHQLMAIGSYWLAVPDIGGVQRGIIAGRKALRSYLSRRRFQEAPQRALLAGPPPRGSALGWQFAIRDAVGSGAVSLTAAPGGAMLRLNPDLPKEWG